MSELSIITATFNAENYLPGLVDSLKSQTDQNFEWVVVDGGSTDKTLEILSETSRCLKKVVIDSRPDFGIYDALNRGIKASKGRYYLVAGADDIFYPDAVLSYKEAINKTGTDFVTALVSSNGKVHGPRRFMAPWLFGPFAYISSHAIGLATKRSLHEVFGFYSNQYPIGADQLFILNAIKSGATHSSHDFVAGRFDTESGTSGKNVLCSLLDGYRVKINLGYSKAVQTFLLLLRLARHWKRI